jgi:holin-like protein
LSLPIPGPVIGLVLLFLGLAYQGLRNSVTTQSIAETELGRTAAGLLQNLSLLFVPAGVGVIDNLELLSRYGLALALSLIISTALTLVVTALVFIGVKRGLARHRA